MGNDKNVLIVGGSRGIGFAVANDFVKHGYSITITSRSKSDLDEAAKIISNNKSVDLLAYAVDISDKHSVDKLVKSHIDRFGSIDTVVNAAAIQGPMGPLWENDSDEWINTVNINLIGAFNICKASIKEMINVNEGTIIQFSGGGAAYARSNFSAYGSSKTAVLRMIETLAIELNDYNINIYAIAPGAVKTKMTEQVLEHPDLVGEVAYLEAQKVSDGEGVSPEKAAVLCTFLADKKPQCLNGRLIHVNEPYFDYINSDNLDNKEGGLLRRLPFKM